MTAIGTPYIASGKVDWGRFIISLIFGCMLAAILGTFYGAVTQFNPFAILNIPLLIIAILLLIAVIYAIQNRSKSRNAMINIVIAVCLCGAAYYAQWVYFIATHQAISYFSALTHSLSTLSAIKVWILYGNIPLIRYNSEGWAFSGIMVSLLYLIELFLFFLPVALTHLPNVFCEHCQRYNYSFKFYSSDVNLINKFEHSILGQYTFIKHIHPQLNTAIDKVSQKTEHCQIIELLYCKCLACQKNNFLSVNVLNYKRHTKNQRLQPKKVEQKLNHMAIDQKTSQLFEPLLINAKASGKVE